mmetsp:Transcript_26324/g.87715  ORF Transcript_26324/g.87715 Transcript_26324/m.87715 type:complete len:134 (+) Transcript_26324:842-1243(+)
MSQPTRAQAVQMAAAGRAYKARAKAEGMRAEAASRAAEAAESASRQARRELDAALARVAALEAEVGRAGRIAASLEPPPHLHSGSATPLAPAGGGSGSVAVGSGAGETARAGLRIDAVSGDRVRLSVTAAARG